jgi:hypothetical protein
MDYYFGAGNRYVITPFNNSGRFRIDFLTLERPGRPQAILEHHAALEDDPDKYPDIEDYPLLSRFIRITDSTGGTHKIFNHQQADYFAQFNGFLSGHPVMVYDACLERCFEVGDFSWLFKSDGVEYLQRATDLAKLYIEAQELVRAKQQATPKPSRKPATKKAGAAESNTLN